VVVRIEKSLIYTVRKMGYLQLTRPPQLCYHSRSKACRFRVHRRMVSGKGNIRH